MSDSDVMNKLETTADSARSAASGVAAEASGQARAAVDEARSQVTDLVSTTRGEVQSQAQAQTQRAAQGLRTLADQAQALADGRPQDAGRLGEWLRDGQQRLSRLAGRLDAQGPEGVLHDVAAFARRRPMAFLGACLGAGLLVGRLVKDSADGSTGGSSGARPAAQLPAPAMGARPGIAPDAEVMPSDGEARPAGTSSTAMGATTDVPPISGRFGAASGVDAPAGAPALGSEEGLGS